MSLHSQASHLVNGNDIQFEYNTNVQDGPNNVNTKKKNKKKKKKNKTSASLQPDMPLPTLIGQDLNDPEFKYPDSRILKQNSNGDIIVESLDEKTSNSNTSGKNKTKSQQKNEGGLIPEDPELLNQELKEYWLSLSSDEKKDMLNAERNSVFKVIREHQKITCNCSVCARKRQIIEKELKKLYEAYFEGIDSDEMITADLFNNNPPQKLKQLQQLQQKQHQQQQEQAHAHHLQHHHQYQEHLLQHQQQLQQKQQLQHQQLQQQLEQQLEQQQSPQTQAEYQDQNQLLKPFQLQQLELLQQKAQAVQAQALGKSINPNDPSKTKLAKDEIASLNSWLISDSLRASIKKSGDTRLNGILSVAEDLVENDGRKFLEMMEKLAESRIERQSQQLRNADIIANNMNKIEEEENLHYSNSLPDDEYDQTESVPENYFDYVQESTGDITELGREDLHERQVYNILDPIWNVPDDEDDPDYVPSETDDFDNAVLEEYYSEGFTDDHNIYESDDENVNAAYLNTDEPKLYTILDTVWDVEESEEADPDFFPSVDDELTDDILEEYYSEGFTDADDNADDYDGVDDTELEVGSLNYPLSFIESHFKRQNELQEQLERECKELERLEDELCEVESQEFEEDEYLRDELQRYEDTLLKKYSGIARAAQAHSHSHGDQPCDYELEFEDNDVDEDEKTTYGNPISHLSFTEEERMVQEYLKRAAAGELSDLSDEDDIEEIYNENGNGYNEEYREDDDLEDEEDEESQFDEENEGSEYDESVIDEEQHLEEGRAMLQLCTTKMLRQSLLASYKKKKQEEALRALVEDLDDEEEKEKAKQEKKQRQKEKQREKKRIQQQQKEAERLEKEAEEERKRKENEEQTKKRNEERRKRKEEEERKALEEKRRKAAELEKIRKEKEEKRKAEEAKKFAEEEKLKEASRLKKEEEEEVRISKIKQEESLKKDVSNISSLPSFEKLSLKTQLPEETFLSQSSSSTHLYDSIYQKSPFSSNPLLNSNPQLQPEQLQSNPSPNPSVLGPNLGLDPKFQVPVSKHTPEPQFYSPSLAEPISTTNQTLQPPSTSQSPWSKNSVLKGANFYNSFNLPQNQNPPHTQPANPLPSTSDSNGFGFRSQSVNSQNSFTPQLQAPSFGGSDIDMLSNSLASTNLGNYNSLGSDLLSNYQLWSGNSNQSMHTTWNQTTPTPIPSNNFPNVAPLYPHSASITPFNQTQDMMKEYHLKIFTAYMLSQSTHLEGDYMPVDQLYNSYISYNGQDVSFDLFKTLIQQNSPGYQFTTLMGNNGDIRYVKITSYTTAANPINNGINGHRPSADYLDSTTGGTTSLHLNPTGSIWN